jgi:hypothetical protein
MMYSRQTLYVLLFFLLVFGSLQTAFGGDTDLAHQNPLLRDYFRQLVLGISTGSYAADRVVFRHANSVEEDPFLESRVDGLVQDFFDRLNRKMRALNSHFNEVAKRQEQFVAPRAAFDGQEQQTLWKQSLKALQDEAGDLRSMLSFILESLPSKTDFKPQLRDGEGVAGYEEEVEFMRKQIKKAERGIRNIFLAPTFTVHVQDINRENLLINLYRVSKMSEALRKSL